MDILTIDHLTKVYGSGPTALKAPSCLHIGHLKNLYCFLCAKRFFLRSAFTVHSYLAFKNF